MRARVLILAVCCLTLAAACASTSLAPVTDPGFTAFEGDEMVLWVRSAEQAKRINESGFLYDNKELEAYVNSVARKLEPTQAYEWIPFTVKVIRDPYLNAFALANGAVYLHTGMLATMENEAQLATLLGHEMTHATNRHSIKQAREIKNTVTVMSSLLLATGGLAGVFGPVAKASVYGYSRDIEREADQEGFRLTERAGYDPAESVKLFEQIKREIEEEKIEEPFFFGTHPRVMERIESYNALIAARTGKERAKVTNADVYQGHIKKLVLDNAQLDLQTGRYERAASALKRYIERYPNEAGAYYLLGEANRQQGGGDHDKKAEESYQRALSLNADHFDSHKMLGIMRFKAGDKAAAKEHLEKYLVLNAKAADRTYIERYIKACEQGTLQK
jgi:predicted Zn-dependent protease